jgi:hypothetical protein
MYMKKSSSNRQAVLELPTKLLGGIPYKGFEPIDRQSNVHLLIRGSNYREVFVAEVIYLLIPDAGSRRSHGPVDTPSVHVVIRHLNKSLMHYLRSVEWDKGFEAVRDTPGLCVDKHSGNALPLPCLRFNLALRMFYSTSNAGRT